MKCAGGLVEVHGLSSLIGIEGTSPALEGEFFFFFLIFIYLFVFGCTGPLLLCMGSSVAAGSGGSSVAAVLRHLIAVASLFAEQRL